jgi:hypothetical protein
MDQWLTIHGPEQTLWLNLAHALWVRDQASGELPSLHIGFPGRAELALTGDERQAVLRQLAHVTRQAPYSGQPYPVVREYMGAGS